MKILNSKNKTKYIMYDIFATVDYYYEDFINSINSYLDGKVKNVQLINFGEYSAKLQEKYENT